MAFPNEIGEKLQKERHREEANVHAVDVRIGRENDLVVAEIFQSILNSQRGLEKIKLLILIHDLAGHSVGIERLSPEGEDGLGVDAAGLGD